MVESLAQVADKRGVADVRERDVHAEAQVAAGKCLADAHLCASGGRSSKHDSASGGRGPSGHTSLDLAASNPYESAADAGKAGALVGAAAATLEAANRPTPPRDSMDRIRDIQAMSSGDRAQVHAHEVLTAMANAGGLGDISRISSYGYHQVAPGESLKVGDVVQQKSQSYSNPEIIRSAEMAKDWDAKRQKSDVRAYSSDK